MAVRKTPFPKIDKITEDIKAQNHNISGLSSLGVQTKTRYKGAPGISGKNWRAGEKPFHVLDKWVVDKAEEEEYDAPPAPIVNPGEEDDGTFDEPGDEDWGRWGYYDDASPPEWHTQWMDGDEPTEYWTDYIAYLEANMPHWSFPAEWDPSIDDFWPFPISAQEWDHIPDFSFEELDSLSAYGSCSAIEHVDGIVVKDAEPVEDDGDFTEETHENVLDLNGGMEQTYSNWNDWTDEIVSEDSISIVHGANGVGRNFVKRMANNLDDQTGPKSYIELETPITGVCWWSVWICKSAHTNTDSTIIRAYDSEGRELFSFDQPHTDHPTHPYFRLNYGTEQSDVMTTTYGDFTWYHIMFKMDFSEAGSPTVQLHINDDGESTAERPCFNSLSVDIQKISLEIPTDMGTSTDKGLAYFDSVILPTQGNIIDDALANYPAPTYDDDFYRAYLHFPPTQEGTATCLIKADFTDQDCYIELRGQGAGQDMIGPALYLKAPLHSNRLAYDKYYELVVIEKEAGSWDSIYTETGYNINSNEWTRISIKFRCLDPKINDEFTGDPRNPYNVRYDLFVEDDFVGTYNFAVEGGNPQYLDIFMVASHHTKFADSHFYVDGVGISGKGTFKVASGTNQYIEYEGIGTEFEEGRNIGSGVLGANSLIVDNKTLLKGDTRILGDVDVAQDINGNNLLAPTTNDYKKDLVVFDRNWVAGTDEIPFWTTYNATIEAEINDHQNAVRLESDPSSPLDPPTIEELGFMARTWGTASGVGKAQVRGFLSCWMRFPDQRGDLPSYLRFKLRDDEHLAGDYQTADKIRYNKIEGLDYWGYIDSMAAEIILKANPDGDNVVLRSDKDDPVRNGIYYGQEEIGRGNPNQWMHVVVEWDCEICKFKLWLNHEYIGQYSFVEPLHQIDTIVFYVGGNPYSYGRTGDDYTVGSENNYSGVAYIDAVITSFNGATEDQMFNNYFGFLKGNKIEVKTIESEDITGKIIKIDSEGDHSVDDAIFNLKAMDIVDSNFLDWGISGTPSDFTMDESGPPDYQPDSYTIEPYLDHHQYILKISDATSWGGIHKSITYEDGAISFYIRLTSISHSAILSLADNIAFGNWKVAGVYINCGAVQYINSNGDWVSSGYSLEANVWYHFRLVFSAGNTQQIYLDGTEIVDVACEGGAPTYLRIATHTDDVYFDNLFLEFGNQVSYDESVFDEPHNLVLYDHSATSMANCFTNKFKMGIGSYLSFRMASSDVSYENKVEIFECSDDEENPKISLRISSELIQHYNTTWNNLVAATDGTFYHIMIKIVSTTTATYWVNGDEIGTFNIDESLSSSTGVLDRIEFSTDTTSTGYSSYYNSFYVGNSKTIAQYSLADGMLACKGALIGEDPINKYIENLGDARYPNRFRLNFHLYADGGGDAYGLCALASVQGLLSTWGVGYLGTVYTTNTSNYLSVVLALPSEWKKYTSITLVSKWINQSDGQNYTFYHNIVDYGGWQDPEPSAVGGDAASGYMATISTTLTTGCPSGMLQLSFKSGLGNMYCGLYSIEIYGS
jgi:hypothetical protein